MDIITRSEARQLGAKRYFTGVPCLRGHISQRSVANGICVECTLRSPDRVDDLRAAIAIKKAARDANEPIYFIGRPCKHGHYSPRFTSNGACVKCAKMWRSSNRSICNKYSAEWVERNPEKAKLMSRVGASNRRARKIASGGHHTLDEVMLLLRRQRYLCANPLCRVSIRKEFHEDHIVPIVLGGTSDIRNIQLLCPPCNLKKGSKDPIVWAQQNGLLL